MMAGRGEKEALCEAAGLPVCPLVHRGALSFADIPALAARKSAFGDEQAEGIVIENPRTGLFGKFMSGEFQQGLEDAENRRRGRWVRNSLAGTG